MALQKQLELALTNLSREDPSLRVTHDAESGQTILSGMGELHLEVIRERIRSDYKVDADLGRLMVAYKETPTTTHVEDFHFDRQVGDKRHIVDLKIRVAPSHKEGDEETKPSWSVSTYDQETEPVRKKTLVYESLIKAKLASTV
jgi:elongation factor G